MSEEQKKDYMAELDAWFEEKILTPMRGAWLHYSQAGEGPLGLDAKSRIGELEADAKRLIREKVLESYRNGRAASKNGSRESRGSYRR